MDAVKAALADGVVDAIATDHAPHAQENQGSPLRGRLRAGCSAPEETAAGHSLALTELDLPIERILALLSWQPAVIAGLTAEHGGPVAVGRPANLCVIDPSAKWIVVTRPRWRAAVATPPYAGAGPGRTGPPHHPSGRTRRHRRGGATMIGQNRAEKRLQIVPTDRIGPADEIGPAMTKQRATALSEALLVLADGTTFEGEAIGWWDRRQPTPATGEVVFNTTLTGYQEVLTDPSYAGQVICFTYPHIGNYGITPADNESRRAFCRGLIVREVAPRPSSWRSQQSLSDFLEEQRLPGLAGIDTRRLTRHIRDTGSMPGAFGPVSGPGAI